ncbi:MAG: hypothetical protein Kow0060_23080 [Methylohalobius crimeensis]
MFTQNQDKSGYQSLAIAVSKTKKVLVLALIGFVQASLAGQTQQVMIAEGGCTPQQVEVFRGDMLRWVNQASFTKEVFSPLFDSLAISPGASYEFTFDPDPIFAQPVEIDYKCAGTPGTIIVHNAPINIFPKINVVSRFTPFDVTVYLISGVVNGEPALFPEIKRLSLMVDGVPFFEGTVEEFETFFSTLVGNPTFENRWWVLYEDCKLGCFPDDEGYGYFVFTVPAGFFDVGRHTVRATVTMTTSGGETTYEDEGSYVILRAKDPFAA